MGIFTSIYCTFVRNDTIPAGGAGFTTGRPMPLPDALQSIKGYISAFPAATSFGRRATIPTGNKAHCPAIPRKTTVKKKQSARVRRHSLIGTHPLQTIPRTEFFLNIRESNGLPYLPGKGGRERLKTGVQDGVIRAGLLIFSKRRPHLIPV